MRSLKLRPFEMAALGMLHLLQFGEVFQGLLTEA